MNDSTKIKTIAALSVCLAACGDLVDPSAGATQVAYVPMGDVAAFTSRALLMLDDKLDRLKARVSYGEASDESSSDWKTLSADGRVAAAAGPTDMDFGSRLTVFRVPGGERLMTTDTVLLESFHLSANGDLLAVVASRGGAWRYVAGQKEGFGGAQPVVAVYATESGALLWETPRDRGSKFSFAVNNGDRLFGGWSAEDRALHLKAWEVRTGQPVYDVRQPVSHLLALVPTPDGESLLGSVLQMTDSPVSRDPASRGTADPWALALFRTGDGGLERVVPQPAGFANANHLAMSPDGSLWAAATMRAPAIPAIGTVQIWRADGTLLQAFDKEVFSLAFAPDGRSIATVDLDHAVSIYSANTGQRLARRDFSADIF